MGHRSPKSGTIPYMETSNDHQIWKVKKPPVVNISLNTFLARGLSRADWRSRRHSIPSDQGWGMLQQDGFSTRVLYLVLSLYSNVACRSHLQACCMSKILPLLYSMYTWIIYSTIYRPLDLRRNSLASCLIFKVPVFLWYMLSSCISCFISLCHFLPLLIPPVSHKPHLVYLVCFACFVLTLFLTYPFPSMFVLLLILFWATCVESSYQLHCILWSWVWASHTERVKVICLSCFLLSFATCSSYMLLMLHW